MVNLRGFINKALFTGALALAVGSYSGSVSADSGTSQVFRSNVSTNVDYAVFNINGKKFQEGVSFGIEGKLDISIIGWLGAYGDLEFNHQEYSAVDVPVTETINDFDLSFGAKATLYSSGSFRIYLDVGAKYFLDDEGMAFDKSSAYIVKNVGGPAFKLGFESRNLDVVISFSELMGERTSSFEEKDNYEVKQLGLEILSRFWRIEMPVSGKAILGSVKDYQIDYPDFLLKFKFKPGIDLSSHVNTFVKLEYDFTLGAEMYEIWKIGGGVKIKW